MPRESKPALRARAVATADALAAAHPDAKVALENWQTPWELLVATILSAQCTDVKVNQITRDLFKRYQTLADYAAADPAVFEQDIHGTGLFRNKTQSILGSAQALLDRFAGQVPSTMDELLTLPGVARKTASVILGGAFGLSEGIVVDTHVTRLSLRMGLLPQQKTKTLNTDRIERDLMALIPKDRWFQFANTMIFHGRRVCDAKKPDCIACTIQPQCPRRGL
jgi:endonuclease III